MLAAYQSGNPLWLVALQSWILFELVFEMEQVILRANNRRKTMQNLQGNHQTSPQTPFWGYRNVSLVLSPPTFIKGSPLVSLNKARFGGCDLDSNWKKPVLRHIMNIYEHWNIHEYPVGLKVKRIPNFATWCTVRKNNYDGTWKDNW